MSNDTTNIAASQLATDLAALRADITRLSETMSALVRAQADSAGAAVKSAVGDARQHFSHAAAQAQDSASARRPISSGASREVR